ncbi:MAG: metallophosphoesterase [Clostridia bacterium]|nr:metallophosphoesterase [Clostridia bacterium]
MNIITTEITLGLESPVTLLHISDTHLALADERDGERKVALAAKRSPHFSRAESSLVEAAALSKELGAPIVHTGDLIDFVSKLNLERAKRFMDENDVIFAAGNHEFSLYVGEAFEDAAYRNQSLDEVQKAFPEDIRFNSRIIGGVNLVGIDNGYYLFEKEQLDALKAEAAKGLPIILLMHNPLYEAKLYDLMINQRKSPCAYLVATPEELMTNYDEYRFRQQKADAITLETVDYIKNEPLIKALLIGHLHFDYEGSVTETLTQYVTGIGTIRKIILK